MNCVTEMQDDFPQRKAAFDSELEAMDQQIAALNNLLGRWGCVAGEIDQAQLGLKPIE